MYYYAISFPLSIVYVAFHIYFCKLCCHFLRVQNIFKFLLRDLLTHGLFITVWFNFQMFWNFPTIIDF